MCWSSPNLTGITIYSLNFGSSTFSQKLTYIAPPRKVGRRFSYWGLVPGWFWVRYRVLFARKNGWVLYLGGGFNLIESTTKIHLKPDDLCRTLYSPPRFNSSPLERGLKWRPPKGSQRKSSTNIMTFQGLLLLLNFRGCSLMLPSRFNCSQRGNDDRTYQSCIAQSWQIAFQEEDGGGS